MVILFSIGFIALSTCLMAVGLVSYRSLIKFHRLYTQAFAQVDIQCRHRYDLIYDLVEAVEVYMQQEHEVLVAILQDRNSAISAYFRASQELGDPELMQCWETAEAALVRSLGRLFALMEVYPDLRTDQRIGRLIEKLAAIENKIMLTCEYANEAAMLYNFRLELFPGCAIADLFNFATAPLLEGCFAEGLESVSSHTDMNLEFIGQGLKLI